jgi:hypothetical protein
VYDIMPITDKSGVPLYWDEGDSFMNGSQMNPKCELVINDAVLHGSISDPSGVLITVSNHTYASGGVHDMAAIITKPSNSAYKNVIVVVMDAEGATIYHSDTDMPYKLPSGSSKDDAGSYITHMFPGDAAPHVLVFMATPTIVARGISVFVGGLHCYTFALQPKYHQTNNISPLFRQL